MAPRLELFHFGHRDLRTGKWIRARYRADRDEIATRYTEWEIVGPAEIRDIDPDARYSRRTLHRLMRRCAGTTSDRPSCIQQSTRPRRFCSQCFCGGTLPTVQGVSGSRR